MKPDSNNNGNEVMWICLGLMADTQPQAIETISFFAEVFSRSTAGITQPHVDDDGIEHGLYCADANHGHLDSNLRIYKGFFKQVVPADRPCLPSPIGAQRGPEEIGSSGYSHETRVSDLWAAQKKTRTLRDV
jgi:hypothetical protein